LSVAATSNLEATSDEEVQRAFVDGKGGCRQLFQAGLPRSGWKLLLIAECEERIVGWCRVFAETVSPFARHVAEVGIGVIEPYREIGIGTHLLRRAIRAAREARLEKLTATAFAINERALNLFIGRGFKVTGRRYRQFNLDGRYIDELLLERFL